MKMVEKNLARTFSLEVVFELSHCETTKKIYRHWEKKEVCLLCATNSSDFLFVVYPTTKPLRRLIFPQWQYVHSRLQEVIQANRLKFIILVIKEPILPYTKKLNTGQIIHDFSHINRLTRKVFLSIRRSIFSNTCN